MKSKKIVAMIVAFAALMAVATSGLAATTTYNYLNDGYVDVRVEATADEGSEVTYLVETPNEIVYIDQQTADDGVVNFNYKILASKLDGVTADVKFGTDGANGVAGISGIEELAFAPASVTGNNIEVTYWKDADCASDAIGADATLGTGDAIYAKIVAVGDFKIASYTKGEDTVAVDAASKIIKLAYGDVVTVATEAIVQTPEFVDTQITVEDVKKEDGSVEKVNVMKITGPYTEAGVTFEGQKYPAMASEGVNYTGAEYFAVKLIVPAEYADKAPVPYFD